MDSERERERERKKESAVLIHNLQKLHQITRFDNSIDKVEISLLLAATISI